MTSKIIRLTSGHTDLIIRTEPAEILYWGTHLDIDDVSEFEALTIDRGVSNGGLDIDTPVTFAAENGRGYFGCSSLDGHRDGYDWAPVFVTKNVMKNDNNLIIEAEDTIAKLVFKTEIESDENGIFKFRNTVTNLGDRKFTVNRLAVTLPVPE